MKNRKRVVAILCFLFILVLAGFVRTYKLGDIPPGLTDDEVNAGYDAYSLFVTGKDQWGYSYPIFSFKGFGDYRSSVYTYLFLPLVPVFGLTSFGLRLPAAFLGTVSVGLLYIVARKFGFSRGMSLMAMFLLSINPWHVGITRTAMVITSGVCFLLLGMVGLLCAGKRLIVVLVSFMFFAFTIYAYPAYLCITPLCMAATILLACKRGICTWRQCAWGVVIFSLIVGPYLFSSKTSSYAVRFNQVNIFKDSGTIDTVNEKIGVCMRTYPAFLCRFSYNKFFVFAANIAGNYIRHFSPDFLFIHGTHTQYSVLPLRGLLFRVEYILLLVGIFFLFRFLHDGIAVFLLLILLFAPIPDSLTGEGHYGRYFIVLPFIQLVCAYGLGRLVGVSRQWLVAVVVAGLVFEAVLFGVEYLTHYPFAYSRYSHFGYKELALRLEKDKHLYDSIYISSGINDAKQYIFYLFYTAYDPVKFQTSDAVYKYIEPNGWVRVETIDNLHFIPSFLPGDIGNLVLQDNVLFVGAPGEFPKGDIPVVWTVKDKRGDALFMAVKGEDLRALEQFSVLPNQ